MATTLAEQLKKLATPQTSILLRDKKRASLLFDSSVAAGIDRDTFYDIGISGLTELEVHNNEFSTFRSTLFSPHTKNFQRAVETKENNQKLDKNIHKFLVMISPYFLLKPAQKALEWLINRYSIHEYNVDDFLMLILPYHETNIFVKCLQLMDLKNNTRWSWLNDLQKPGVHLPKINLFNQCTANVGFLKFIGEMTDRAVKESGVKASSLTTLITFYCTTTIGTLENTPKIKENHVAAILTTLLKSLSSEVPDFVASGYMIVAQLLKKATLSKDILDAFVLKICSDKQKSLRMEGTLLLLLIFQSQHENYKAFPQRAVKNLLKSNWFCTNVANLVLKGSYVLPLLIPVLEAIMHDLEDINRSFIEDLLEKVHLGENDAYVLIKTIIGICLQKTNVSNLTEYDIVDMNETSENIQEWYGQILKRLETQYPNPFDRYVQEITTTKGSNKTRNMLRWIMNQAMSSDKDSFTIFEKLYHPNPEFRANAVRHLVKKYKKLQDPDKEIFRNVISERLLDENRHVVQSVLKLNKADLFELLGENTLSTFVKLLVNCTKKDWLDVAKDVTEVICNDPLVKKPEIFITILPFLFPSNSKQLALTTNILHTKFADYYIFLKKIREKSKNTTPQQLSEIVYDTIIQVSNLPNLDLLLKTIKNIPVLLEIHKFLCLLLMTACVQENSTGCLQVITSTIEYLKIAKIVHENNENISVMTNIVFAKNEECIPLQGVLDCIKLIILRIKSPDGVDWFNLLELNEYNHFLLITFSVLLKKSFMGNKIEVNLYSNVLKVFLTKFFPEFTDRINFLSNLSISNHIDDLNIINPRFQLRVLRLVKTLLQKTKQNVSNLVDFKSPVVISNILIGLSNPMAEVRIVVMEILEILVNYISKNPQNFIPLMEELLKHKEVILLDPEQIGMILLTVKSDSRNMDNIFKHLFKIACNPKNPLYVNAYLAKVLAFINSEVILEETSKYALDLLHSGENMYGYCKSTIIYKMILRITEKFSRDITLESSAWKFMMTALKCDSLNLEYMEEKYKSLPVLVLEQITREFYANLSVDIQKLLLSTLINIASTTNNPEVTQEINKIFKNIDLDAKLIIDILVDMKEVKSKKVKLTKNNKRRLQDVPTIDILDTLEWKSGVTTLEFIQDKKKITNISAILPLLFDVLKKCLAFDEQAALEYPKQIILSLLLHSCEKMALDGEIIPTAQFNVELVVQCVRASQNPQTHHHALLVLAKAATLIPDQVLHHIMAIFTFMGSSVLRHDDAYSFQIISKIIETVIPILIERDSEQKEFNISCVLRVFVDVILDVPVHRRKALFITLLMTLGVEQYLWLFLVLIFEAHVVHGEEKLSSTSDLHTDLEISPKRLDIAANIVLEFSIEVILKTCTKLLEYLKGLPLEKDENMMNVDKCSTFNISLYTAKQFRHYKYILVNFTATLLSSKEFVNRVVVLPSEDAYKLEPLYKNMLINILNYIHVLWKLSEHSTDKPQGLYWKVLLHHCYNVMDSINALLTPEMFLLVIRGLMLHNIMTVRKKALDILNQKLQHEPTFLYNESDSDPPQNEDSIFGLLSVLIAIVKTVSQEEDERDNEKELVQQTALLSLKLFIKLLAPKYTEKFVTILNFTTDLIKSNKVHGNMLASVVLCLAELCSKLRAHSISGLPKFMPHLIKLLKQQKQQETPNLLSMCILTAIQKIVESVPLFLSPYLEKLLIELSILATKWKENDDAQTVTVFLKKLATVRSNIGSLIPPRVLIPIVSSSYDSLAEKNNHLAVGSLLNVLSENLTDLTGQDLTNLLPELTHLFLKAFQIRADNTTLDHDTINSIEDDIIKTFNTLVLKLSETTFRPIYYRLFDWAGGNDAKTKRIITFYRISYGVAQNLKSLFVLFAGHFVKNAASLLDACNCQKNKSLYFKDTKNNTLLIESIIRTLHAVFLFDSTNFVNRERFDSLMQPLVDQLENILDGNQCLKYRSQELLIPCLGQFAVAAADDVLWKQLNYQILLKTRSDVPLVRIIATKALCEVAQKLGDEFLPLLPETIPFLAELLEDEDETVEEECKKSVQKLENVVGEPLQKYF